MALVFLGLGFNRCSGAGQNGDDDEKQGQTIVKVGSKAVTTTDLSAIQNGLMRQHPDAEQSYTSMAKLRAQALSNAVESAAMLNIADQDHIAIDDKAIVNAQADSAQQQIQQTEQQIAATKKLKNPTPQQLSDAFQAQYNFTPTQYIGQITDSAQKALNDPQSRPVVIAEAIPVIVAEARAKKDAPPDDQLKATYDSYTVKRIFISAKNNANVDQAVAKVQADLKGGMSFENAMDKYSNDPHQPGKKLSEASTTIPAQFLQLEPEYAVLKGQKAGFVSDPLALPGGKGILKLDKVTQDLPKDFATNIEKYRTDAGQSQAASDLQKQVQQIVSGPDTKWSVPGFKALYDVAEATMRSPMPASPGALDALMKEASDAKTSGGSGTAAADDAYFLAVDSLYNAPGADKTKLASMRIDAIKGALENNEDIDLRIELVELYAKQKDGPDAILELISAAKANTMYDGTGQKHFGDVAAKRSELIKDGLAKEADFTELDAAQESWKKGKQDQDKEEAQMHADEAKQKAAQAKLDAENAAAVKKQQEEAGKNKVQSGKFATPAPQQTPASPLNPGQNPGATAPNSGFLPQGSPLTKGK